MRAAVDEGAQACAGAERAQPPPAAVGARARRELKYELDAAVGFADYCRFLAGPKLDARVEEFVAMAQALYEETLTHARPRVLHHPGSRAPRDR